MRVFLLLALMIPRFAAAADLAYPPVMEGSKVEVYRKVGDTELKVWIFGEKIPGKPKPAIVFFFGGGWTSGSPVQFEKQCRYLADRGMIAMTADYRVKSRNHVPAVECVKDAKACVAWIRENAADLGIDPKRIAAGGGSAGGHLAACTATLSGLGSDERPNALILFNPALVLAPLNGKTIRRPGGLPDEERLGIKPEKISPAHHIGSDTPPTLILHGKSDTTVPYITAEAFDGEMKKAGRPCKLVGYDGQAHAFFNKAPYTTRTISEADRFLVGLGWLK